MGGGGTPATEGPDPTKRGESSPPSRLVLQAWSRCGAGPVLSKSTPLWGDQQGLMAAAVKSTRKFRPRTQTAGDAPSGAVIGQRHLRCLLGTVVFPPPCPTARGGSS